MVSNSCSTKDKMTVKLLIVLVALLAAINLAAQPPEEGVESEGIRIVGANVLAKDTDTGTDLIVLFYLKNVGEKEATVLTKRLLIGFGTPKGRPPEIELSLNGSLSFEDSLVVPSFYEFAPVTLKSGESAMVRLPYHCRHKFERVVVVYDMFNDWSKRFGTWYGRVRTEPLKPIRVEQLPKFEQ